MLWLWILIIVPIFLIVMFFWYFNRFAVLENRIENSLSQINVQLKRRADLIPNLIQTVKGYAKHETAAIKTVTDARKTLVGAKGINDKVKADNILESALGKLFAIAEGYPDLKANTNFIELQRELSTTEDRVAYARQHFNDSTMAYHNLYRTMPGAFFAKIYKKEEKEYLKVTEAEKKVVKVEF